MTEKMSKQETAVINKIKEAFELIKEGDGISIYFHMVKKVDDMYLSTESIVGLEEDVFNSMVNLESDEKPTVTKRLFTNFFNYAITRMKGMLPEQRKNGKEQSMKIIKPKGDA